MEWIYDNWLAILLFGGMAAMHLFGHRHGHARARVKSHGGGDQRTRLDIRSGGDGTAIGRSDR